MASSWLERAEDFVRGIVVDAYAARPNDPTHAIEALAASTDRWKCMREYAALGWTPGALSHDFGGRDRGGPLDPYTDASDSQRPASKRRPACVWPPRWRDVAREIMRLPVTVRDEPVAVSGEIAA